MTRLPAALFILAGFAACEPRGTRAPGAVERAATEDAAETPAAESAPRRDSASVAGAETQSVPAAAANGETRELAVPGFGAALIVVPGGAATLPLLVAAHGAGDSPRWQCQHWGAVVRGRFVVLCPRGVALSQGEDPGYFYRDHFALEREVTAALVALRSELGARLSPEDGVYTGYSQGATMGALMIVDHGADFPNLVLVEGGSGEWTLSRAKRFHATGGKSVAIVCGTPGCATRGARSAALLERAGLRARVEHAEGGGHTYVGSVGERATQLLDGWVFTE